MNEWMNERTNELMDKWVAGLKNEQTQWLISRKMNFEFLNEIVSEWMNGRMNWLSNEYMNE